MVVSRDVNPCRGQEKHWQLWQISKVIFKYAWPKEKRMKNSCWKGKQGQENNASFLLFHCKGEEKSCMKVHSRGTLPPKKISQNVGTLQAGQNLIYKSTCLSGF